MCCDCAHLLLQSIICNLLLGLYYISSNVHWRNVLQYLEEAVYFVPSIVHHTNGFFVLIQSFLLKALSDYWWLETAMNYM
jgi:hypothetical protein